jgi:hypothetical protein
VNTIKSRNNADVGWYLPRTYVDGRLNMGTISKLLLGWLFCVLQGRVVARLLNCGSDSSVSWIMELGSSGLFENREKSEIDSTMYKYTTLMR